MDNNHELENQDLRPTTMRDSGAFANNKAGEEISEQDLDAVSGGNGQEMFQQAQENFQQAVQQNAAITQAVQQNNMASPPKIAID